ncbi:MAG: hypothetical protein FJ164_01660 [Gammaproteobacteria bacterium]|nr:hypothetical protein [Gammaproteobacteria bacterium]
MRATPLILSLTSLLACQVAPALDESFARQYGKNRVKVERLEAPKSVSETQMQSARAKYETRMEQCRGEAGRNRQYCMQEAENTLMMEERKIRDRARKAEAEADAAQ